MTDFSPEFFEAAAKSITNGKIKYLNMAGIIVEVVEKNHVRTRLPFNDVHVNHVGIMYAGSYLMIGEATGATLIKCVYGDKYTPIIKEINLDYQKPATSDLVIDLSMDEETAKEKISYVEQKGKGRYFLDVPVCDAEGNQVCLIKMTYYLMKKEA